MEDANKIEDAQRMQPSTSKSAAQQVAKSAESPGKSPFLDSVLNGIGQIKDRKGATLFAIKKFVLAEKENLSKVRMKQCNTNTTKAVRRSVKKGLLLEKSRGRFVLTDQGKLNLKRRLKKSKLAMKKDEKKKTKKTVKKSKAKKRVRKTNTLVRIPKKKKDKGDTVKIPKKKEI